MHVSCMVHRASAAKRIRQATLEGNGVGEWTECGTCGRKFEGLVWVATAWGGWKTYVAGQDEVTLMALNHLGLALHDVERHEDAIPVLEAALVLNRRLLGTKLNLDESGLIAVDLKKWLVDSYHGVNRIDDAVVAARENVAEHRAITRGYGRAGRGPTGYLTFVASYKLLAMLSEQGNDTEPGALFWVEAVTIARENWQLALRTLQLDNEMTRAFGQFFVDVVERERVFTPEIASPENLRLVEKIKRLLGEYDKLY